MGDFIYFVTLLGFYFYLGQLMQIGNFDRFICINESKKIPKMKI